ncbi:MAG: phosphatase PAP2 family protein [Elusimicrobiales bacterium]|nr:phosphatase PAP2 family protein [Elusimicrobiales bacterium]
MLKKAPLFRAFLLSLLVITAGRPAAAQTLEQAAEHLGIHLLPARAFLLPLPGLPVSALEKSAAAGHYLDTASLDFRAVPAAPAAGSREDQEDFRVIFDWQARRTAAQCAAAKAEMSHNYDVFFGRISPFPVPAPAQVKQFFKNVENDSVAAHKFLKDVYKRERPFVRDPRVQPCLPRVQGLSYPSGHSAMARLFALILSDLVPSRRAEFLARADEAALFRVLGGVHHPTDTAAGKALAETLYKQLQKNPAFTAELRALRPLLK